MLSQCSSLIKLGLAGNKIADLQELKVLVSDASTVMEASQGGYGG